MKLTILIIVVIVGVINIAFTYFRFREKLITITCPKIDRSDLHARLYSMMTITDMYLQRYRVPYIVQYGSLLGLIRDKGIIAHDDDIDVDVFEDGVDNLEVAMKALVDASGGKYHFFEFPLFGYKLVETEHWSKECPESGVQLDFFIRTQTGDGLYSLSDRACKMWPHFSTIESRNVFPIRRGMLGSIEVNIPNNPEKFLVQNYGEDWRTPKKTHTHNRT
jgi:hypothetical protein